MKKIVIFSGTTEGRRLSEQLLDTGIAHTVCVASAYGGEMMREDPRVSLHVGRMDAEEMKAFLVSKGFDESCIAVDATHPYAEEVTENIRAAAAHTGCRYLRVLRGQSELPAGKSVVCGDITACAALLKESEGNILLTTGSKELAAFCAAVPEEVRERIFVRVLPTEESLSLCSAAGIDPRHVIAMHGPFSREMNLATLMQYDIRHLVTKESGSAGGFEDKVKAAADADAYLYIIARPAAEAGISVEEALGEILEKPISSEGVCPAEPEMCVTLAGIGMGALWSMTGEVKQAIADADVVFGAARLLRGIRKDECYDMYRAEDIIPVLERVRPRRALILFSGDSGFYSGAKAMKMALVAWRQDVPVRVLPGISSVSALAARVGENYDDAAVVSIHGRKDSKSMHRLMQRVRYNRKTFVLLSGDADVRDIGRELSDRAMEAQVIIGSDLSAENECVWKLTPDEAAAFHEEGVLTALILRNAWEKRPVYPAYDDEAFLRDRIPMTKAAVRHESIRQLGLREGDVVYDIGGGTGSVAMEIAAADPSLTVYTFEKNEKACVLILENKRCLHADNVTVVQGEAPEVFADTEAPDCVFIGGSSGRLSEILTALREKKPGIRCVMNAVTMETTEEAFRITRECGVKDVKMMQLQSVPVKEVGEYHMMQAQNPVMIVSFTLG